MTTWRKEITEAMEKAGDSWANLEGVALAPRKRYDDEPGPTPSLDTVFDGGFGVSEGCWFTLWTTKRVYFPVVYDGGEWADSVPRYPCDEATAHVGGQ